MAGGAWNAWRAKVVAELEMIKNCCCATIAICHSICIACNLHWIMLRMVVGNAHGVLNATGAEQRLLELAAAGKITTLNADLVLALRHVLCVVADTTTEI